MNSCTDLFDLKVRLNYIMIKPLSRCLSLIHWGIFYFLKAIRYMRIFDDLWGDFIDIRSCMIKFINNLCIVDRYYSIGLGLLDNVDQIYYIYTLNLWIFKWLLTFHYSVCRLFDMKKKIYWKIYFFWLCFLWFFWICWVILGGFYSWFFLFKP